MEKRIMKKTWRSLLFIPANNEKFISAAATRQADAIILDLEDSVPNNQKAQVRQSLPLHIEHLSQQGVDVLVRINDNILDAAADLEASVFPDTSAIIIPKVIGEEHLLLIDQAITRIEFQRDIPCGTVKMIALIETINGLEKAQLIARATPRLTGLALGTEDLSLDGGFEPTPENLFLPAQKIIYAARLGSIAAYGFPASIADYSDVERFAAYQQRAKSMGFNGALCIHPKQVVPINEAYMATKAEREWAQKVLVAYEQAMENHRGVIEVDGKMVDAPVVERAKQLLL
ncbi:HpcH/HpaI aldolase/citrate lyase family protein [Eionea flava]